MIQKLERIPLWCWHLAWSLVWSTPQCPSSFHVALCCPSSCHVTQMSDDFLLCTFSLVGPRSGGAEIHCLGLLNWKDQTVSLCLCHCQDHQHSRFCLTMPRSPTIFGLCARGWPPTSSLLLEWVVHMCQACVFSSAAMTSFVPFCQAPTAAESYPGFLPVGEPAQHGERFHPHLWDLRTRERWRRLPLHGLCLTGDLWLLSPEATRGLTPNCCINNTPNSPHFGRQCRERLVAQEQHKSDLCSSTPRSATDQDSSVCMWTCDPRVLTFSSPLLHPLCVTLIALFHFPYGVRSLSLSLFLCCHNVLFLSPMPNQHGFWQAKEEMKHFLACLGEEEEHVCWTFIKKQEVCRTVDKYHCSWVLIDFNDMHINSWCYEVELGVSTGLCIMYIS